MNRNSQTPTHPNHPAVSPVLRYDQAHPNVLADLDSTAIQAILDMECMILGLVEPEAPMRPTPPTRSNELSSSSSTLYALDVDGIRLFSRNPIPEDVITELHKLDWATTGIKYTKKYTSIPYYSNSRATLSVYKISFMSESDAQTLVDHYQTDEEAMKQYNSQLDLVQKYERRRNLIFSAIQDTCCHARQWAMRMSNIKILFHQTQSSLFNPAKDTQDHVSSTTIQETYDLMETFGYSKSSIQEALGEIPPHSYIPIPAYSKQSLEEALAE